MVIRTKPGADKPDVVETFAAGLKDPYGIPFIHRVPTRNGFTSPARRTSCAIL